MTKKVVIIGAGTYGSYLANCIVEKYADARIELFEVGNNRVQSESEIGFLSKISKGAYKAASDGRFFGLGGTSAKWGGQLLFFSDRDFSNAGKMREVVDCNLRYRGRVLSRFFKNVPVLEEKEFECGLFVKQGVWLKFGQRNIFQHFQLAQRRNITVHQNSRVIKLHPENGKIAAITVQSGENGGSVRVEADLFYLTGGAFESLRLLQASNILDITENSRGFSDHVSLRCFKVKGSRAKINNQDFQFYFLDGSLVTTRLIGEIDDASFYVHPIFNEEFKLFQLLKKLMFKGQFAASELFSTGKQFFSVFPFSYDYLIRKKLYIHPDWFLNIDIELSGSDNSIELLLETDAHQQNGINIRYEVSRDTINKLMEAKEKVRCVLNNARIEYEDIDNSRASSINVEDVYHPYGLFSYAENENIFDVYNPVDNLYLFNTGLLPRSGGINPTASIFCLIEHHIERASAAYFE